MPMSLEDHQLYHHVWKANVKGKLIKLVAAFHDPVEAYNLMNHYNENTEHPTNVKYLVFSPNHPVEMHWVYRKVLDGRDEETLVGTFLSKKEALTFSQNRVDPEHAPDNQVVHVVRSFYPPEKGGAK